MKLLKEYYTSNSVTTTPYGIGALLTTVYGEDYKGYMGESLIQTLAHSTMDNFGADLNGIASALYYLNARLETIRKTVTVWDAYQIKGSLQDKDTVLAQLAQLPANSSVVSNITEPFPWVDQNNETITVHKGDILFKDANENIIHVKSLSSGYYAPMSITSQTGNNNITINYQYFTDIPLDDAFTGEKPTQKIPLEAPIKQEESGYDNTGNLAAGASLVINYKTKNNINVEPIVKYYTENGEQVLLDITYSSADGSFTIKNTSTLPLKYEVK